MHTSSAGQGPGSRCSWGDAPRAKEVPGSCQSCSTAQGSTAASRGCSSSQGFNPERRLCWCCCPLARALHKNPSSSPSWAHSAPSSNARGWGRCFTVVLWELPSWRNPCWGHPEGIVPAMVDGSCSSTRLPRLPRHLQLPRVHTARGHERGYELPPAPRKASTAQFHVNTQLPACPETVLGPTAGSCLSSG